MIFLLLKSTEPVIRKQESLQPLKGLCIFLNAAFLITNNTEAALFLAVKYISASPCAAEKKITIYL